MTDDETIALRVTVIGGQRYPDDFTVIVRASGVSSDKVQWSWNCYLHGRPTRGGESGPATIWTTAKAQFREAWATFGPGAPMRTSRGRSDTGGQHRGARRV
jgi:hypothetical protein